jgi:hypothetical protein
MGEVLLDKQSQDADAMAESEAVKRALGVVMLLVLGAAAYLVMHTLRLLWPARYAIGALVAAGEVAFFVLWCRRYTQLNTQPDVHAPAHVDSMRLFDRFVSLCYSLPDGVDLETYLSAWFRWAGAEAARVAGCASRQEGSRDRAPPGDGARVRQGVQRLRCLVCRRVAPTAPLGVELHCVQE